MTRIFKSELGIRYIRKDKIHFNSESVNIVRTRNYGKAGKGIAIWIKRLRDVVSSRD